MIPTGIILAVLDCDADSIEAWNRWYDLEHIPPNVWLPGVMLGRRYVATPELHDLRVTDPSSGFANQRGTFVTIYTLCAPPAETVAAMSTLRDKLYAEDRMTFPPEKKIVRAGGSMELVSAVSSAELKLPLGEVPFVGHTGLLVVQRRADATVSSWYRTEWASRVVAVDGVHGVMTARLSGLEGEETDMIFLEGDTAAQTKAIRDAAPHHPEVRLLADVPLQLIDPLRYPWADAIRQSTLPKTVA